MHKRLTLLLSLLLPLGVLAADWNIVVPPSLQSDEAVKVALDDLTEAGKDFEIEFRITGAEEEPEGNTITIGSPDINSFTRNLTEAGTLSLKGADHEQGYEIATADVDGNRLIALQGGAELGTAYGIFWLANRLKVNGELPEINTVRVPEMKIRFGGGNTKEQMRTALRYGATWVWGGPSSNHLIPWDTEPEKSDNAANREKIRELIDYAHALHLKFIIYEDEFSFHPTLLEEFNATLNPEDPAFWEAVQAKYRRLLAALPEVDEIRIRSGESTRVGGNYRAFDVMHDGDSHWSLAQRYRTFVKKIHEVVVGEFDKIYYQRTWVTSAHEQHSMAEVYREIFTDDVPVKNLYMSPYLSTTDRYFFQPYNPTFNQTPHNMILLLSPLNYHGNNGCNILPTFPGTYYQGGLKTILSAEQTSCKGFDFGTRPVDAWDTWTLTAYTVYRLAWEPHIDVKEIARDFASVWFGKEAADGIGELLMLSSNTYKYGMYIEPAAHGQFASLTHLRLTTFPVKGLPRLDSGKKHMDFLYDIYLRCRPWIEETYLYLDHGMQLAEKMQGITEVAVSRISDETKKELIQMNTDLTLKLVKVNNLYVKTFISCFQYMEDPAADNKTQLKHFSEQLSAAMQKLKNAPGNQYRLDGMEQLQVNVAQVLEDSEKTKQILANAPDDEGIRDIISDQQKKYTVVLEKYKDEAVKLVYWQGRVDGRDLFKVKGSEIEIEHLRYDQIVETSQEFFAELPAKDYTVVPVNIQSRSFGPFVLEQPSAENDYQVTLYLSDFPMHGYSWWKFELWYIPRPPAEVGLEVPWK